MENKKYTIPIDNIANFSVGKKFFVLQKKDVKYLPNENPITIPIRVAELGIKKILLFTDNKTTIGIKIIWDTDNYTDIEDELFSYVYLNDKGKIVDRNGADFSEKEIGANNMYHKASIKANKCLSVISSKLHHEITKSMETVFNNESALDIINNCKKMLCDE